jgi:hypothetical protein
MSGIEDNQDSFRSLRARCEAVIRSPLLRRPQQLQMAGELKLLKPRKIHLVLRRAGQIAVRLVGDGKHYQVSMPIFRGSYSGSYGDPIEGNTKRIHFMPDDLTDALDMRGLFWGKPQVLKAYPNCWDLNVGSLASPETYPPVWLIDSLDISTDPETQIRVDNSVLLDRQNEQIRRIDKFRRDGSLRVRMWHLNPGLIQDRKGQTVRLPGGLLLLYPAPLEGTVIRLRFTRRELNVPIPEETFLLSGQ